MASGSYNKGALSRTARVALGSQWYDATDLLRAINDIRSMNLSYQAQRDQALSTLNGSKTNLPPYGVTKRFPADRDLVCESYGGWLKFFEQLRTALSFKDQDNLKPNRGTTKPKDEKGNTDVDDQSRSDAFKSAYAATSAMIEKIRSLSDVLDQAEFERVFGCTWYGADGVKVAPKKLVDDEDQDQDD